MAVFRTICNPLSWTCLLFITVGAAPAWAEDAIVELPSVIVEAARSNLQDSGVVTHVAVEPLGATSLAELLATLPGVQVRTSSGLGSYSEASLRGSSGRQVRILLDGLPLDTGGGEASSLSLINPLLLDGVDIYKGRVPVGLGSGLAGTINLHSRKELAAPVVGSATIGSFGERQVNLAAQPIESTQIAIGGQSADNNFKYVNKFKPFDPTDPDRTRPEERRNAGTEQYYGLIRYRGPVEISLHAVDDTQHLPTRQNDVNTKTELDTKSYALSLTTPEESIWQAALSHRFTQEKFHDPDSQLGLGAQDTSSNTQRTLLSLGRRFDSLQDTFSAEHTYYAATDPLAGVATGHARRLTLSDGIAAQTGGARKFNGSLQAGWTRDQADDSTEDYWQIEPAIGVSQKFDSCLGSANIGHRRRLPTFFERYGDRGLFKGNPNLNPESANYADIGVRCAPDKNAQRFELTAFGQDLHDPISPTYNAQGVGRSVNSDRGLIYGVELDTSGVIAGFGWQIGGTWQHTEDRSDVHATRGKQLPGRFESQFNARVERSWRELVFYYAYRLEAGEYYDSVNILPAPTLQEHNVGVRGEISKLGWSLQALNLANKNFEQFNGFPTPGRRILFSVTYPNTQSTVPALPEPSSSQPGSQPLGPESHI